MADTRIKGQEFELILIENNVPLATIQDIKSFEMEAQLEILKEGYLGETTDRRDSVYRGYRGKMDVHFENRDIIDFAIRVIDGARRRTAGTRVNLKVTLAFPEGERVRVTLKDLKFGGIPISVGSRSDYANISLDFEGSDFSVI